LAQIARAGTRRAHQDGGFGAPPDAQVGAGIAGVGERLVADPFANGAQFFVARNVAASVARDYFIENAEMGRHFICDRQIGACRENQMMMRGVLPAQVVEQRFDTRHRGEPERQRRVCTRRGRQTETG
jgi:hypothetical protein